MSPAYDPRVERAETELARAEVDARRNQRENDPGTIAFPAWLRIQHWSRLAHSQQHQVHWWYVETGHSAVCTCGLLHPLPPPPVAEVEGHRDPQTWDQTGLLIVYFPPASRPSAGAEQQTSSPWRATSHQVACQICGLRNPPLLLQDAMRVRLAHAAAPCAAPPVKKEHPRR